MYIQISIFALAFTVSFAEPPRYSTSQFQKVEVPPYSYSGWRPSGPEFKVPEPHRIYGPPQQEQYQVPKALVQEYLPPFPQQTYGGPSQEYVNPSQEYRPPSQEYGSPSQEHRLANQGYRPPSQEYGLPSQEHRPTNQEYRSPSQEYRPPSQEYGSPQEYGPPSQEYRPPSLEYGPPPQEYGPPEEGNTTTTTVEPEVTTTELPTTTESNELEPEEVGSGGTEEESGKLTNADEGVYYIYHPSGLLQRVVYATKDDVEKMAFSARLKYENVEPIRGPIFTYDPETFVFKKL